MRRILLIGSMIMLVASLVFAQPGTIQLAADPGVSSCDITDAVGLVTVYVFHINTSGSTASQFKIEPSAGVTMTHIADNSAFLKIGSSQIGIAIAYQACYTGPLEILNMSYIGSATTEACSELAVVEDPTASVPGLYVTDCADPPNKLIGLGSIARINPDGTCPCPDIVPVEDTSWGQIKAIYRQ